MLRGPIVVGAHAEPLEERCVMTVGPGLVSVAPNVGAFLNNNDIRTESPREFVFQFSPGHIININSLAAIEIVRSGGDGIFGAGGTAADVAVPAAYVDQLNSAEPNKIVYRFASTPVNDHYRIVIHGTGPGPVLMSDKGVFGDTINDAQQIGADETLDFRLDLGAQVVSVVPQPITRDGTGALVQADKQIHVFFNNDDLVDTPAVAENPAFYQLIDTKGTSATTDDTISLPTSVTYDQTLDRAVLTFASIPTGTYKLKIGSSQEGDDTTTTAVNLGTLFSGSGFTTTANLGDKSSGGIADPANADLYRFEIPAGGGIVTVKTTPSSTLNTFIDLLGGTGTSLGIPFTDNNTNGGIDTLTSGVLAEGTYFARITSSGAATVGSYLIDITVSNALAISDDNSSYLTATDLGVLGAAGKTLSATIHAQDGTADALGVTSATVSIPDMPGASDEPGHRDTPVEGSHGIGALGAPATPSAISVFNYNFDADYGSPVFGQVLKNQITEGQKARIRELFEVWSRDFGIQFVETAKAIGNSLQIVVGDPRAVDKTLPIGISVSAGSLLVLNTTTDESYGGGFMGVAMHEIGHSVGLGHAGELHAFMNGGGGSPNGETLYVEHDAVHMRNIYPLLSTDIDLYKFNVTQTGTFTAGVTAELKSSASLLDSALTLFRDPFATISSDFGSSGNVTVTFTSDSAGVVGNDIRLIINTSPFPAANVGVPTVSVSGHTITVTLDTTTPTTATQLETALNNNAAAALLINTSIAGPGGGGASVAGIATGTTLALGGGNREVVARNDDYNSNDAFLSTLLEPGTYYVGVTSTGNTNYDPTISNSGFGGNTDGAYDLQLSFSTPVSASLATLASPITTTIQTSFQVEDASFLPSVDSDRLSEDFVIQIGSEQMKVTHVAGKTVTVVRGTSPGTYPAGTAITSTSGLTLTDTDNELTASASATAQLTSLDGDADGIAGGDFNFWFQSGTTIFVDKTYVGTETGERLTPFNDIGSALSRAASRIVAPINGAAGILDGDFFTINDGTNLTRVFEFNRTDVGGGVNGSNIAISIDPTDLPSDIATEIAAVIETQWGLGNILTRATATGDHVDLSNLTTLDVQHSNGLLNAPNLVRIVGNNGADLSLANEGDAVPYVIGVDNFGVTLVDGRTFDVPQGVTVMIDAGTVIKLQNANIDVGTDPNVIGANRQDGALQIFGTPKQSGTQNNAVYLTSFRNDSIGGDSDSASAGPVAGQWGGVIFRRDSDMNDAVFGDQDGANVFLNSIYQADLSYGGGAAPTVFSTIHIVNERPTIAFSQITHSADAAISANPNSFDDSLGRIGPDIHGNSLAFNTVNGLLVRIDATVNSPADQLDVRGRFNDTDLTHVISNQLLITGNAGGATIVNEVQQLDVQGSPVSGFFTLTSSVSAVTPINSTTLNTPITAVQTTFSVANATVLPGGSVFVAPFNIRIDGEEMLVTNKNGNVLTVVRGVNGTGPSVAHNTGATVARSRITTALPHAASAAQIQLALEYIDGIGEGKVRVTGGSMTQAPANIEFISSLGSANQLNRLSVQNSPPGQIAISGGNVTLTRITAGGVQTARPGGRLQIDPGVVVKLSKARIEGERGSAQLIAEGTSSLPVIFTSLQDDRFGGASGTFDSSNNGAVAASRADWGGLFFGQGGRINVDHAYIAYGGGEVPIAGDDASFAAIEVHEADLRLTNTLFEFNANGADGSARNFRTGNDGSVVFVKGAQPIIINNTFHNNDGSVISIDANAMKALNIKDTGRTTGEADVFDEFANNQGPLVRLNRMANDIAGFSGVLGMEVRAAEITSESVWDDTDIVHVVESGIFSIDNVHTAGGLRLQSAPDASLVVKLGAGAGFDIGNADKNNNNQLDLPDDGPLEINDRIGGTMQIVGAPGFPVVLTSLRDDSVGASLDTRGFPQTDTNGDGIDVITNATGARTPDGIDDKTGLAFAGTQPAAGNWGEIAFDKYAHDRNVIVVNELEKPLTGGIDTNNRLVSILDNTAEYLGNLALDNKSANENRRAGFELHGHIAQDDPTDVDIYKFVADGATEIWLDIDFTDPALDTIIEFVSANGTMLARSQDNTNLTSTASLTPLPLLKSANLGNDYYTTTVRDAGMRLVTPGAQGSTNTYFIRVRSNTANLLNISDLKGGLTSGEYQLQVRLGQRDETPGVSVKFADIRYATNGIHVKGLPYHSPLLGESSETGTNDATNNTASATNAINLGNLLYSDRGSLSAGGNLLDEGDIDFYRFSIDIKKIQEIVGINGGPQTWATIIDLDWADGLTRPDTTIAIFRHNGQLVYMGRESNVADDQPAAGQNQDLDDLTRGSVGKFDPFIGTAMFEEDSNQDNVNEYYYLAVVNNQQQPTALNANFFSGSANATRTRLEPVTSLRRLAEDHIGFQGYTSNGTKVDPRSFEDVNNNGQYDAGVDLNYDGSNSLTIKPLLDITNETTLAANVTDFDLSDVVLFVSQNDQLRMVNPLTGASVVVYDTQLSGGNFPTRDIAMSSDGILFGYQSVVNTTNTVGRLVRLNTGTGAAVSIGNDGIAGENPTQTSQDPADTSGTAGGNDFDDITTSNSVDAMTVERTGVPNDLPTYIGWYSVNENGLDASDAPSVNSKLYRASLTTGAVANGGNDSGFGDIQYAGVGYASGLASVSSSSNTGFIYFQSKAPGLAGDGMMLDLQFSAPGPDDARVNITTATGVVSVEIGRSTTAQAIVNAINQHPTASQMMTASIRSAAGSGGTAPGTTGSVSDGTATGGVGVPLRGNVTGLSFNTAEPNNLAANRLYGVTSAGELIWIDRLTPDSSSSTIATATLVTDFLNSVDADIVTARGAGFTGFSALTLGPQNLHDGLFRQTLFATTNNTVAGVTTSRLIAFDIGGADDGVTLVNAFGSDNETQTITSDRTSGTFTLDYTYPLTGEVLKTAPLNFDATAAQVRTALLGMVTSGGLFPFLATDLPVANVTGGPLNTTPINITFQGFYTDKDVAPLTLTSIDLAGGTAASVGTTIIGGNGVREFSFRALAGGAVTGLAFSNLDFNLWHPTMRRGDSNVDTVAGLDTGHGINIAFDNSRAPQDEAQTVQGRLQNEAVGGASFYFGVEAFQPNANQTAYLNYQSGRGQYGVEDNDYHRDITSNVLHNALGLNNSPATNNPISNNYNLPGGAYGTMTTNPISLAGYNSADKPTLYFNYFLTTQDAAGDETDDDMRDSARVFASTDGGRTWRMIATNNTTMTTAASTGELPEFIAHSSDYNNSPMQELFDTSNWRQARIDLSQFANQATVQFRFDFATAGKINETGLPGESFGQFRDADGADAEQKAQNNNFEGFYIDDIIVGVAERGELVTGAPTDLTTFDDLYSNTFASGKADINNLEEPPSIVTSGTYQVEVRRGTEYAAVSDPKDPISPIKVFQQFDANDRLIVDVLTQPTPLTENFDQAPGFAPFNPNFQPAAGSSADWSKVDLASFPSGGSAPRAFRSGAITSGQQSGETLTMATGAGKVSFSVAIDAAAPANPFALNNYNSVQFLINGVAQPWNIAGAGNPTDPLGVTGNARLNGVGTVTPAFVSVSFDIAASPPGTPHTFEWRYLKGANSTVFGTDAAYIDNLIIPLPATQGRLGDQNVDREQGMVVLEGNFIRNVSGTGIIIEPGNRDSGGAAPTNLPYGGAVRQVGSVTNDEQWVTHAALVNNVITNFGAAGIQFSGDPNLGAVPDAAVPLGKLINNTIYGGGIATGGTAQAGTGILITNNASPTLLNNIVANTALGISIDATSLTSDVTKTLFQNNFNNQDGNNATAIGSSAIRNSGDTSPLFVSPAAGNFYLAKGIAGNANEAIDSSINSRLARTEYTKTTNPLGIPFDLNPFDAVFPGQDQFAPDIDRFGQIRRDDPNTSNALGIFRDIGGIERADFAGPTANLTTPLDDGDDDLEPTKATIVSIDDPELFTQLVVTLLDIDNTSGQNGIGVDDTLPSLVTGTAFVITQTDITGTLVLVPGTHYTYAYNANTNEAIFTSLTVFPSEARYNITVENDPLDTDAVFDLAGNVLQNNRNDGSVQFDILVTNGVNDRPVLTLPSSPPSTLENTAILLSGANAVVLADSDAFLSNGVLELTLTASNGTFRLATVTGLDFTFPADTAANEMAPTSGFATPNVAALTPPAGAGATSAKFRGTLADLQAAINGLRFLPDPDLNDSLGDGASNDISLDFKLNDLGNYWLDANGTDDPKANDLALPHKLRFLVQPVNSTPTVTLPATPSTNEDTDLTFAGNVSVADPDSNATPNPMLTAIVEVTVSVTNGTGTFSLDPTDLGLLSFTGFPNAAGDGTSNQTMTFRGTLADINDALDGSKYIPKLDFFGTTTLTVTINDLGNAPTGGAPKSATKTTTITVDSQPDPDTYSVKQNSGEIDANDPDGALTTTDTSDDGVLVNDLSPAQFLLVPGTFAAALATSPAYAVPGSFVFNSNGTFTYIHDPANTTDSTDEFTYTITGFPDPITVTINVNLAPTFDAGSINQTVNIFENSPDGTLVKDLDATDPDPGQTATLTYSIESVTPNNGAFAINSSTGVITVNDSTKLNFETTPTFTLTVRATDNAPINAREFVETTLTIKLNDVGENLIVNPADLVAAGVHDVRLVLSGGLLHVFTPTNTDIVAPHDPAFVNQVLITGENDFSNKLTIDFSGGSPFGTALPAPTNRVVFDGGEDVTAPINDNDTLVLTGDTVGSVIYTFTNGSSGTVNVDGDVVSYTGLEPILDELVATDRTFTFSNVPDTITLNDSGTNADGKSVISTAGTSETVIFVNPTTSLTINADAVAGTGADTLKLLGLDPSITPTSGVTVNGRGGNDTLSGLVSSPNTFEMSGPNAGTLNIVFNFTGIETLQGGSGTDVLSYSAYGIGSPVTVNLLTGLTPTDLSRISSIEHVIGGDGADVLTGSSGADTLEGGDGADLLTGGSGNDSLNGGVGNDILVDGIGNDILVGGADDDRYKLPLLLTPGATQALDNSGSGAGSKDTVDFTGAAAGVTFDMDLLATAQTVFGAGTPGVTVTLTGEFSGFVGTSHNDSVKAKLTTLGRTIDGAGQSALGSDTFTAVSSDALGWTINGTGAGTIEDTATGLLTLTFLGLENLVGSAAADTFGFAGGSVPGTINGAGGANVLSYAAHGTAATVDLQKSTATGILTGPTGTLPGFSNLQSYIGNTANPALKDTLIGKNSTTSWFITDDNTGNFTNALPATPTVFTSFENLTGGTGNDSFFLSNGIGVSGTINGGAHVSPGTDTLNYSAYTTQVDVIVGGASTGVGTAVLGIETFVGGSGVAPIKDTLTGPTANNTWNLTSATGGNIANSAGTVVVTYSLFESFIGGSLDDNFKISSGVTIGGAIDGKSGLKDTLDLSGLGAASPRTVVLTGDDGTGFTGTDTGAITGGFKGIDSIIATAATTDSLQGIDGKNATWEIYGSNRYIDLSSGKALEFSAFEKFVVGTPSDNTFKVKGSQTATLQGGAGADTFIFHDGAKLTGKVDGGVGPGTDTLSFAPATTAQTFTLTGLGASHGFSGKVESGNPLTKVISGDFTNIDTIAGGFGGDTLIGRDEVATWTVGTTGLYKETDVGGRMLPFSSIETLTGGNKVDTFVISGNQSVNLNGGIGDDIFDFQEGASLNGIITGGAGNDTVSFFGNANAATIGNIPGSVNLNNLSTIVNGQLDLIEKVIGSGVTDTLIGLTSGSVFDINSALGDDSGTVTPAGATTPVTTFEDFENLKGSSGADTFKFTGSGSLTGAIDGGLGSDTLSFAGLASSRTITLSALGTLDGFNGTEDTGDVLLDGFNNINSITGSSSSDDQFIGAIPNPANPLRDLDAVWEINSSMSYSAGGRTLTFAAWETMTGGSGNDLFTITGVRSGDLHGGTGGGLDTFRFAAGATLAGEIDGDEGNDTLSFEFYTTALNATLGENQPSGYRGGVVLSSIAATNVLTSFQNVDTLIGGTASDTLNGITDSPAAWKIDGDNFYSSPSLTFDIGDYLNFRSFESLNGGDEDDTFRVLGLSQTVNLSGNGGQDQFILLGNSNVNGIIDGGADEDKFDLSGKASGQTVSISNLISIEEVIGSSAIDTLVGAPSASTTFVIFGPNPNSGTAGSIGFTGFENLQGGTKNDSFEFQDGGTITGTINGGAGSDALRFTDMTSSQAISLTGLGATDGFTGNAGTTVANFTNIDSLFGSGESDSVRGRDANSTWTSSGATINYTSSRTINLSSFEVLQGGIGIDIFTLNGSTVTAANGGSGSDTLVTANADGDVFTVSGANSGNLGSVAFAGVENLRGGNGTDRFLFSGGSPSLSGTIDGGSGTDTLSFADTSLAQAIVLTALGTSDGFKGTSTSISPNGFNNINTLVGSTAASDSVKGRNAAATWTSSVLTVTYKDNTSSRTINIASDVEKLLGGTAVDTVTLSGATPIKTVDGDAGNDVINASAVTSNITLIGNAGDDKLTGGAGNDSLDGGIGVDTINGGINGKDTIRGGAGNDKLDGGAGGTTVGTAPSSALADADDIIHGGDGNDSILGQGGNDFLFGEAGNDTIDGGDGHDVIDTGSFSANNASFDTSSHLNKVLGGSGNDAIRGGAGKDTLNGGEGNDCILGGTGADSLLGGNGDDVLRGQDGNDTLAGEGGTGDSLDGGTGTNSSSTGEFSGDFSAVFSDTSFNTLIASIP